MIDADNPRITLEDVACPLCGKHDEEEFLSASDPYGATRHRLVSCRGCGMTYLNPRPDPACIHHFYSESYKPYQSRGVEGRRVSKRRLLASSADRDSLTSLPFHGRGKLLDVGCGSGWFAHRMRLRGWDVTGIDFSEHAVKQARRDFGFPVHHGSLPHPAIRPRSFDVINLGCVLEHVHDPHRLLDASHQAIRPGGYVAVTVPNFASWSMRHFGRHCFHLDLPRHLLHFTPETLRRMLEMHGLHVKSLRMLARASWMRRTLEAVCKASDASGKQKLMARLGKLPLVRSLLTRWTVRRGEADGMIALAYKPVTNGLTRQVTETGCQTGAARVQQGDAVLSTP